MQTSPLQPVQSFWNLMSVFPLLFRRNFSLVTFFIEDAFCKTNRLIALPPDAHNFTSLQHAYPINEVNEWLQSLSAHDQHSSRSNSFTNVSSIYVTRNGTTPGGAIVMDHMLRHGMWAPVETRIFHHIILVSDICLIFQCFDFTELPFGLIDGASMNAHVDFGSVSFEISHRKQWNKTF